MRMAGLVVSVVGPTDHCIHLCYGWLFRGNAQRPILEMAFIYGFDFQKFLGFLSLCQVGFVLGLSQCYDLKVRFSRQQGLAE